MPNKTVIRAGDKVKLIDPRTIVRIGYDTDIEAMVRIAAQNNDVIEFCRKMNLSHRHSNQVIRAIARSMMSKSMKRGSERKIFFSSSKTHLDGKEFWVQSKHVRYTGVYEPSYGGRSYDGEYEIDPPYLSGLKAHVILELVEYEPYTDLKMLLFPCYEHGYFVTTDQVEKI